MEFELNITQVNLDIISRIMTNKFGHKITVVACPICERIATDDLQEHCQKMNDSEHLALIFT